MTDRRTILTVIYFLGGIAVLLVGGSIFLTNRVIGQASDGSVDPTAVAVLAGVTSLTGSAVGALGSLLASTRSSAPEALPTTPSDGGPTA